MKFKIVLVVFSFIKLKKIAFYFFSLTIFFFFFFISYQIFNCITKKLVHQYSTQFPNAIFSVKIFSLRSTKYSISFSGPKIWNEFLTHEEKALESHRLFLKKTNLHYLIMKTKENTSIMNHNLH